MKRWLGTVGHVARNLALVMIAVAISMLLGNRFRWLQEMGNRIGMGKKGWAYAFLAGVGAGFIAAPCTGPILAMLLTYAANLEFLSKATLLLFFPKILPSFPIVVVLPTPLTPTTIITCGL